MYINKHMYEYVYLYMYVYIYTYIRDIHIYEHYV